MPAGSHLSEHWGCFKRGLRNLLALAANRPVCGTFCYHSYLQVFLCLKIVISSLGLLEFMYASLPVTFLEYLYFLTCWADFQPCFCNRNSSINTWVMSCGVCVHFIVRCLQPLNQALRESWNGLHLSFSYQFSIFLNFNLLADAVY